MKITEVRIFSTESRDGKLKAFATMTFDDWFVVRNVKVIQGNNGLFVAMPSRKAVTACSKCQYKNVVGSKYCNQCGAPVRAQPTHHEDSKDSHGGGHMDIAHPITQECRIYIQEMILDAYNKEAKQEKPAVKPEEKVAEKAPVEEKKEEAQPEEDKEEEQQPKVEEPKEEPKEEPQPKVEEPEVKKEERQPEEKQPKEEKKEDLIPGNDGSDIAL